MLKKHEALMADIEAYSSVIRTLNEQSQKCKVSSDHFLMGILQKPMKIVIIQMGS